MAPTESIDEVREKSNFPPADVHGSLNPGSNNRVQVDPVLSDVAVSTENKEQAEIKEKKNKKDQEDAVHTMKSAIVISSIIVALAGAVFAITKKLREK